MGSIAIQQLHCVWLALGYHWFRQCLDACPAPSHYLNQCQVVDNWTHRNKFHWNFQCSRKNFHGSSDICLMGFIYSIQICVISHQTFGPSHRKGLMIFTNTEFESWYQIFIQGNVIEMPHPQNGDYFILASHMCLLLKEIVKYKGYISYHLTAFSFPNIYKTDVERRQTLGHPRSINPNMINHVPQQPPLIF